MHLLNSLTQNTAYPQTNNIQRLVYRQNYGLKENTHTHTKLKKKNFYAAQRTTEPGLA